MLEDHVSNVITNAMVNHDVGVSFTDIAMILSLFARLLDQELNSIVEQFNNELEQLKST